MLGVRHGASGALRRRRWTHVAFIVSSVMALNVPASATLAVDPEPTTSLFAVGLYTIGGDGDYLTPPDWNFYQPLNTPVDLASVMVLIRNATAPSQSWYMEFAGQAGMELSQGTFTFNERADFRTGDHAGFEMTVTGGGGSCSDPHGSFTIHELERRADGIATKFAATFDVRCTDQDVLGGYTHGELNIESTRAWPAWRADKVRLDFPSMIVGDVSTQPLTISSIGSEPVTIQAQITGNDAVEYSIEDDLHCLGSALDPGTSCTFDVVLAPTYRGAPFAALNLSSDAFKSVWFVGLWGTVRDRTSITLATGASTAAYPFGINASVHVTGGNGRGPVSFEAGADVLGDANISQGDGSTVLYFPPGQHELVARYLGNSSSAPSVSQPRTIQGRLGTSTTLTSYEDGSNRRFLARVIPPGSYDLSGGTLSLIDVGSGTVLATTTISGHLGEVWVSCTRSAGERPIKAVYSGHGLFDGSTKTLAYGCVLPELDVTRPLGTVEINGGADYTNSNLITLTFDAVDPAPGSGVVSMQFKLSEDDWPSFWQPYAISAPFTLDGADGVKGVDARFRDGTGNISTTALASIVLDRQPPVGNPPDETFVVGSTVASGSSILITYGGSSDATSGVASNQLEQSSNGGTSYTALSVPAATSSTIRLLTPGTTTYRFRSRPLDAAGNVGVWSVGPTITVVRAQENASSVGYSGAWTRKSSSKASAGAFRQTKAAGASVTFTFTGRDVSFFARSGPNAGKADIYIDGVKVASGLDFYAASANWKRVMFAASFLGNGPHTVQIRVLGTKSAASSGTAVNIDGFQVIK